MLTLFRECCFWRGFSTCPHFSCRCLIKRIPAGGKQQQIDADKDANGGRRRRRRVGEIRRLINNDKSKKNKEGWHNENKCNWRIYLTCYQIFWRVETGGVALTHWLWDWIPLRSSWKRTISPFRLASRESSYCSFWKEHFTFNDASLLLQQSADKD